MKQRTDNDVLDNYLLPESYIQIHAMTKEETKNHGENLNITYSFGKCPFGRIMIASTIKGFCSVSMSFEEDSAAIQRLRQMFPKAQIKFAKEPSHQNLLKVFDKSNNNPKPISLHLKGTDFQLRVWKALLTIPFGKILSYGEIASGIGHPNACRAVGTAVGHNPIFFLIPCHRVIRSSGAIGNYYWGTNVKTDILNWEKSRLFQ